MERWRGNGGWIPVVRHRNGGGSKRSESSHGLFTIFVDNLPQSMDVRSLFKLFTKFGIVKDAYIPFKRRVATNSRFGFVRFDCSVAADIAIQKANGLLVDDRELEVKKASHERGSQVEHSKRRSQPMSRFSGTGNIRGHPSGAGQKSYAEVLKGKNPVVAGTVSTTIKVDEVGHFWI
ncbi:polyadenylate-binding protein 3-like [Camellia sinensis]|uniref:polyadenylate-binding protein 3-like n=1 Tax=Camellia sinensis TaxID=4442 RepID=UPI001036AFBF|nr:polyadenylate-binding protein 3-like [Camellia sinensis]